MDYGDIWPPAGNALSLATVSSNVLICVLASAHNELLKRIDYDVKTKRLRGTPSIRVITGVGAHSCVRTALSRECELRSILSLR